MTVRQLIGRLLECDMNTPVIDRYGCDIKDIGFEYDYRDRSLLVLMDDPNCPYSTWTVKQLIMALVEFNCNYVIHDHCLCEITDVAKWDGKLVIDAER